MGAIFSVLICFISAFIFLMVKVLKNTFSNSQDIPQEVDMMTAFNNIYYPCTLVHTLGFNNRDIDQVIDFSVYEEKGIIGLTTYTEQSELDFLGFQEGEMVSELLIAAAHRPQIYENVLVYSPIEGVWTWKSW